MRNEIKGAAAVLLSAFLFYLATFFVKSGAPATTSDSIIYLAARFWIGYFFMLIWYPVFKKVRIKNLETINTKWLWYRAFWNLVAVMFFYLGVIYGSLTGANILNMTYPVFVAILSIYFLNERPDITTWLGVLLSVAGAVFVLLSTTSAGTLTAKAGDIFGILSGITAGLAIVALRIIRITDSTDAALFYNFRLGFWVTLLPVLYCIFYTDLTKHPGNFTYPLLSGITGILGQVALTYGFKYITAVNGSILSATRLIFAVIIGWIFFRNEVNIFSVTGAALIFLANIVIVIKKFRA